MIFEFERKNGNKVKARVRRESSPRVEVDLADAQRALHDIRLALYHARGTVSRGADAADSIARDSLGAEQ